MPKPCFRRFHILKLTFICCASLSLLSSTTKAQTSGRWAANPHERRSLTPSQNATYGTPTARTGGGLSPQSGTSDPRACQKLPITPDTWKLLNIDDMLKSLPGGQNMTIAQYATANGAENCICGIGESFNAGQLCHPIKAPAWQVLYAVQEYNAFMNAMMDSINYALSQLQAISASMANDLSADINDSRLVVNLEWIFTDMYRGIAYGATSLFIITLLAFSPLTSVVIAVDILFLTGIGAGIAAWIQGAPKTSSFVPWTKLGFYLAQAQEKLASHVTEATDKTFTTGITSENGLASILSNGHFFVPPTPSGLMETMEKSILRVVQGRLLTRLLRGQNAYVTITQSECNDKGPGGARGGEDILSYCDPQEKLLYNIVRAHKKKTINQIHGAATITTKYGFDVEFIVKNSRQCQEKYGNFEHDPFADISKVSPANLTSLDCIMNLPVCDMRLDDVRHLKFGKHKTTTVACRKGAGLPI